MSGVRLVAKSLVERMGYRSLSREDLIARVNRHGDIANQVVERVGNATRAYDEFSQLRRPYVILMRLALLEYIRDDNVVYHGYSGQLLVPPLSHVLRVRVTASLAMRLRMTMDRLGYDEKAAREYVQTQDEARVRWARFMYGRDIRDPELYDLVVNLNRLPVPVVCTLVQATAADSRFAATEEVRQEVDALLLASRIEAALATDERTRCVEIAAHVGAKRVKLVGPWLAESQREAVLAVARSASGGRELEYVTGYEPVMEIPVPIG
jgi:two-component system response regulator CpxR